MTDRVLPNHYDLEEEVREIMSLQKWPYYPILPVKKVDGSWECGIVVAPFLSTIIMVNLWALSGMSSEDLLKIERLQFDTVEAMVAAGWIGD